jgi:2-isopropylmalate synthase
MIVKTTEHFGRRKSIGDYKLNTMIYDTTLRDGSQTEGISFSLEDKLRIARKLDHLGVSYIEGGWPGSNPKDLEFFSQIKKGSPEKC